MMKDHSASNSKVTIADIARDSGVSPATVSLVLRDKPGIGAETRQRVLESAQNLGYLYRPTHQSQTSAKITNFGLIIKVGPYDDPHSNIFYTPVMSGIETICRRSRVNLLYTTMPVDEHNNPLELPPLFTEGQVDGILLVGMHLNETMDAFLQQQSFPVVLVDAYTAGHPYDSVVSDNVDGAYQAVRYLIQNGHRHIGIIGSEPDSYPSVQERRQGYLKALQEHALTPYLVDCALLPESASVAASALLRKHPEITAIFGCNDEVAIAVMQVATKLGREVPRDLSVIGFDNIALAQHITPPLTTMRIDKMGMGRLAAQLLLNRLEFPEAAKVQTVIHPHLIERQSVRPPKV